jgi:hypothetical protein
MKQPAVEAPLERGVRRPRSLLDTLERAASLLANEAQSLKEAHTLKGRWTGSTLDEDARLAHEEMCEAIKDLRAAAKYLRANPLGGPAKVFDACADTIRAGDSVEFAMANYGLAWAPNVRANRPSGAAQE